MFPQGSRLFVATPCYGGLVTQRFMYSMMGLVQRGVMAGLTTQVEMLGYESLITRGRNTLVSRFLDTPSASHLLFVDADIGFEPDQVFRMLAFDADVVAGMYPLKLIDWESGLSRAHAGEPVETAPMRYVGAPREGEEAQNRDGFVTADYAGTGFMLIRREVFARMAQAYPHLRYAACHNSHRPSFSPNQYAFFDGMIEPETGTYLSEDYTFCRRWRDLGGEIWLDTQGVLTHVGPHEFIGAPNLRFPPPTNSALQHRAA
ncbi:hypothetical protein CCR94_07965 [Rhodoblastus sphagnicola]|uniref:Nucleotide-diphospho-sugar transferase domain-containing protein n=1 Tax=Rhodoblastus sphagnicola TaxID=333368 RepID=A0A2S6NBB9_9HYPH|nr:hypothetical protein [Rhodoblastus sphagnicola]MBB4197753.1 hypothetical protein [Rhodoblastus sphagnicola]PPQ31897.1 hypothetical protein CCR94_07965 [Rhodoblastus sphagnicola]